MCYVRAFYPVVYRFFFFFWFCKNCDMYANLIMLLYKQAQFSQMRPVAMTPVAPRMPIYPPGGPGMGQQIFYGQAPPAIIPSQVIYSSSFEVF